MAPVWRPNRLPACRSSAATGRSPTAARSARRRSKRTLGRPPQRQESAPRRGRQPRRARTSALAAGSSFATSAAPRTTATALRSRPACVPARTPSASPRRSALPMRGSRSSPPSRPASTPRSRRKRMPRRRRGSAFLVVYLGPLEEDDPFAAITAVRCPWGIASDLTQARSGRAERTTRRGNRDGRGLPPLRGTGREPGGGDQRRSGWTPEQRFERAARASRAARAAGSGSLRPARDARGARSPSASAPSLLVVDDDPVTVAAKRIFGIGDRMILESRAKRLASAVRLAGRGARPGDRELGGQRADHAGRSRCRRHRRRRAGARGPRPLIS